MPKLNMFQKDLLLLVILLAIEITVTFFLVHTTGIYENVAVHRNVITLHFQSAQGSFSFTPWSGIMYLFVLILLLLKKEKPLTIIYGLGLIMLVQFNFLRTLYGLENQVVSSFNIYGRLSKEVVINQTIVAHDITLYILLAMVLIKAVIVLYKPINKAYQKLFLKEASSNDKVIHL